MTIETGALEQAYIDLEASYNPAAVAALGAADGIRHLELTVSGKHNREASPEKRGTPDEQQSLPRRHTAAWNLSSVMWEPSGTPGTEANVGRLLKAGMGAQHTVTGGLTTTVSAAPAPTATGATLTSVVGLAVGDVIAVTVAGEREATRIKTLAGSAITFDALSAAPDVPGEVVGGITYQLASLITQSFAVYKYYNAGNFKQAAYGSVVDQITVTFDGTREVLLAISGPSARYSDSSPGGGTVQAKPAAHTTVGAPVGGMVGSFFADTGVEFPVISVQVTIANNLELRNKELGTAYASGIAGRANNRQVGVTMTFYLEDLRVLGMAHTFTRGVLRLLVGDTAGSMLAAILPGVEFEIPDVGNEIGPKELTITGKAYATNGNDQVFLAEL